MVLLLLQICVYLFIAYTVFEFKLNQTNEEYNSTPEYHPVVKAIACMGALIMGYYIGNLIVLFLL